MVGVRKSINFLPKLEKMASRFIFHKNPARRVVTIHSTPPLMASFPSSPFFISLLFLLLLLLPFHSDANLHKTTLRRPDLLYDSDLATIANHSTPPTVFFEVTKPIDTPKAKPCSLLVLHHEEGNSIESSAFGLAVLRFFVAARRSLGLRGSFGQFRRTLRGLDGAFLTKVTRSVSSSGWVKSSLGIVTTETNQDLRYSNSMVMGNDGNSQIVNQEIQFNCSVHAKKKSSVVYSFKSLKTFPLYMYSDIKDGGNGSYESLANLTLGFNEKKSDGVGSFMSSVKNVQNGQGRMVVKGHLVASGLGSTQQDYRFHGDEHCYSRNISSSNYIIVYDDVKKICGKKKMESAGGFRFRRWPIPGSLDSNFHGNGGRLQ